MEVKIGKEEVTTLFEALTKYIEVFEKAKGGEWIVDKEHAGTLDDPKQMPFVDYDQSVEKFIYDVHDMVNEHKDLKLYQYFEVLEAEGYPVSDYGSPSRFPIEEMGLTSVLALIVAIVRQERFNDGLLLKQLNNGTMLRCLRRIKKLDV